MNRRLALLAAAALSLVGCGRKADESSMAGMTAEEHARMTAGGAAGGDTGSRGQPVRLTAAQARAIGVTYATVRRGPLHRTVRTVGQIVPAESRLAEVTAKVDGYVDRLFVNATGMPVREGQPLLTLYSPMLISAQQELLTALRLAGSVDSGDTEAWRNAQGLLQATRRRLSYWDISDDQIEQLERTGEVSRALTLRAPLDGVVLEKMVVAGQAVMPGMKLYRLADLSTVWIEGEVFEQDLALVRVGTSSVVEFAAYPGRQFDGRVSFVYPTVDQQSRTARVRVVLPNPGRQLRPGMYGTLTFAALLGGDRLSVPADAVVMTGERNLVYLVAQDGSLVPREVTVGLRADEGLELLGGVVAGDQIVASANFLVDAESRLATVPGAMPGMPGMPDMPGITKGPEKKKP